MRRSAVVCPGAQARDQGPGGADRRRRRDDPHVGAALRLPGAGAHGGAATGSTPSRTSSRCGGSSPIATAGSPCRRRSSARDRWPARPIGRRSSPRSPPADAPVRPQRLRKPTLVAISRAIEEEALARAAGPVVIGAFQSERNYRAVEHRYRRLAHVADAVGVYATFDAVQARQRRRARRAPGHRRARPRMGGDRRRARLRGLPGGLGAAGLDATRARLRGGVDDGSERRPAGRAGRRRAGRAAARPSGRSGCSSMLADRPLAVESPTSGLTALTNRMLGYLDGAYGRGMRSTARLRIWPVTVKPICVSSPAARIVVVTSSVPFGAPIGCGGGAGFARCVFSGGEAERTAARPPDRLRAAGLRRACVSRRGRSRSARGAPSRSGRLDGSPPRTLGSLLVRHRSPSVRLDLCDRSLTSVRAAVHTPDIGPARTAGGSRESQRLDSAATVSVGGGLPSKRCQAHIQNGRLSQGASLERDIHVSCGSAGTRRSQGTDPQGPAGGRLDVRRDLDRRSGDGSRRDRHRGAAHVPRALRDRAGRRDRPGARRRAGGPRAG